MSNQLQPGPELDDWLAKHLMGWKWLPARGDEQPCWRTPDGLFRKKSPPWSTSADAFLCDCVSAMRKWGTYSPDCWGDDDGWCATFYGRAPGLESFVASHSTFAGAMALAAREAIESEWE